VKSLLDHFRSRPDWQSDDPAVRAEAVLRLPASESETLLAIAREDPEARVRRAAARKLDLAEALAALASSDEDASVREEAAARLLHLAVHARGIDEAAVPLATLKDARALATVARTALHPEVRGAAVSALEDARALASVARDADDVATALLALERIDDSASLQSLAMKSDRKAVALGAVERIDDPAALREIAEHARSSAAARRARARIEGAAPEATPATVTPSPEELEAERRAYEQARAEQEREATRRAEAVLAREELCAAVEGAEGEGIDAAVERAKAAWSGVPELSGPDAESLEARFEAAVAEAGRRRETWKAGLVRRGEIEELVTRAERVADAEDLAASDAEWSEVSRLWTALAATADQPDLRARYEAAASRRRERGRATREDRERADQENLDRLSALAERAEECVAAESASLRDAGQLFRDVRTALESPGHFPTRHDRDAVLARLGAVRPKLYGRLQQLRDDAEWKRWANTDVQEELCGRAEALLAEEDLAKVARELRDIDIRWKQAREAPKDKAEELWTRFQAARETLREKVDAFLAEEAERHQENVRQKVALCEKAEALAESTDWVQAKNELRTLQEEWKRIGPVPRTESERLWKRFRKPCDRFFSRWHEQRKERTREWADNLARKEALCEKAEGLQESTDWEETASALKGLQAEWRTIGAVKRSRSDAVWQRFRAACDHFFERYKHKDSLALESTKNARELLCAELEGLLAGDSAPEPADVLARVVAAQTGWRQAGELPRDLLAPLEARFAEARANVVEAFPEAFAGSELDPEASRRKAEKLIGRVEQILEDLAPAASAPVASAEELAARLRDALAANTIGGREAVEARWITASSEVEQAQSAWRRLGPMPRADAQALTERFEAACRTFFERRPKIERPRAERSRGERPSARRGPRRSRT